MGASLLVRLPGCSILSSGGTVSPQPVGLRLGQWLRKGGGSLPGQVLSGAHGFLVVVWTEGYCTEESLYISAECPHL